MTNWNEVNGAACCTNGWRDPRDDTMAALNELMFRTGAYVAETYNETVLRPLLDEIFTAVGDVVPLLTLDIKHQIIMFQLVAEIGVGKDMYTIWKSNGTLCKIYRVICCISQCIPSFSRELGRQLRLVSGVSREQLSRSDSSEVR